MSTASTPLSPSDLSIVRRWRVARWLLLSGAAVATLIAVFYAEENWRGRRAWEKCRRDLEAQGEVLDWGAYIPPPIPDDQNFYKAPKMREWFVKENFAIGEAGPPGASRPFMAVPQKVGGLVLGEVKVVTPSEPFDTPVPDAAWRLKDQSAREQAAQALQTAIGPCLISPRADVLVARSLDQFKPRHWVLQADAPSGVKELTAFFPPNPFTNSLRAAPNAGYLQVEATGSNTFRISLKGPVYGAADYLAWTETLAPDFDLLRTALERPYARIECDYQRPYEIAIPNFIMIRNVAQTASQRAQCFLLLGQPDAALRELTLVRDLCQILLAKPFGKPLTLVGAMINVAVTGLYTGIVEDGLRLHGWREPQLLVIERQLKDTDLLGPVVEAFREERAATCRTIEITERGDLVKLFNTTPVSTLALGWMPRGWFYQNMVVGSQMEQELLGSLDLTNRLIRPHQISNLIARLSAASEQRSPYRFLAAIATPNFAKAVQTAARTQTLVNHARLACALERYRVAKGRYPEKLAVLTPAFIDELPRDLIGGRPLHYRRTEDGGYLLYSIGWNEKDDGGVAGKSRDEGDWVFGRENP